MNQQETREAQGADEYHTRQTARRAVKYAAAAGFALGALKALHMAYELPDDVHAAVTDAMEELQEQLDRAQE